ncbi:hypothetical protein [Streptococcus pyogenes]|uniref:spr1630 family ClpXP-sensitive toxin n=1 Tax=Streptococcus pyogenes TaxID=1314 RepID=UPI00052A248E|nr:hypothetical protein [Streptococcus pyogenes]AIW12461.1 hypothetical protein STAB904_08890 [Streptococcus pyogenes]OAC81103.1 hypothetical protein AWU12_05700 [Streptococcus pyogenes]OAC85068.1 hypothetical protein AWU13_01440 [Streptococcus pyogenes]OAC85211.1 hypothetical protein AWU14_03230 [Streptococcus pyogenes]OAC87905.1 hypothetical protein AWU15_06990 [Streptococcus pyogenes]
MELFNVDEAQEIVNNIILGYNNYLQMRIEKKEEMSVSTGFAWTKSNYIDDAFDKSQSKFLKRYALKKAGESWEYLEFYADTAFGKTLILFKGESRSKQVFGKSSRTKSSYLYKNASINKEIVKTISGDTEAKEITIQLDLFDDELFSEDFKSKFDCFLMIAYEPNQSERRLLKSVKVLLPDPISDKLLDIQDLSAYISSSPIQPIEDPKNIIPTLNEDVEVEDFGLIPLKKKQSL